MTGSDASILFEYLRRILFSAQTDPLDIETLSPEFRELGEGMNFLHKCVREMQEFTVAVSHGDLNAPAPSRDNNLGWPLKELRSNLAHLTWQTKQVAKGDYLQRVDFLGEFSTAFNTMVEQLSQREKQLREETQRTASKAEALSEANELLSRITDSMQEWIVVLDSSTGGLLFTNRSASLFWEQQSHAAADVEKQLLRHDLDAQHRSWEMAISLAEGEPQELLFQVTSFRIEWKNRMANAYLIADVTLQREHDRELEQYAYQDVGTGLFNRRYCMDRLSALLTEKRPFSLCFIDLDHLKLVNDRFGHDEGDRYLLSTAHVLREIFRSDDILCRIGGDEFVVLLPNGSESLASHMAEQAYQLLRLRGEEGAYPMHMSYGVVAVSAASALSPEEILKLADRRMYAYKQTHRLPSREFPAAPSA